ncbi:MAG TPA: type III pantothenate kinase [Rhodocyclaceae bacterium]
MTLLCIDCGNTRLKWALREPGRWLAVDALPTGEAPRLGDALPDVPARIAACNVAGAAAEKEIQALAARLRIPLLWVRAEPSRCGVTNRYDNPAQLGADRWAALIGARGLHAGPCVVVNAGTATTIDVLDETGVFQGGLILPGLALMRDALARNTAGLPRAQGEFRELPRNTDDAIASGCLNATAGAVERMFRRLPADALCLLSGGAADALAPLLPLPHRSVPNLVLEGLARIAESE